MFPSFTVLASGHATCKSGQCIPRFCHCFVSIYLYWYNKFIYLNLIFLEGFFDKLPIWYMEITLPQCRIISPQIGFIVNAGESSYTVRYIFSQPRHPSHGGARVILLLVVTIHTKRKVLGCLRELVFSHWSRVLSKTVKDTFKNHGTLCTGPKKTLENMYC